ncbi:AIG2-like family protein [Rubripirellula amarantea]|uniref:AIG2-like family protein n=1 Tax=Rubripirellula amarantea TaxID=2527999 RepID=A0A5C5WY34_9BACT|nr:gamma-glutamylcyclotransferase family protein [Rubripirellula amarantea]TWT54991.1 AIG2-like family protein [Rubripirellula amarantea]
MNDLLPKDLYFAYGSNLNVPEFRSWCQRNGFLNAFIEPIVVARLSGYALSFSHYSRARNGGALNVVPSENEYVDGVVFQVPGPEGWAALDAKEGFPKRYQKESLSLKTDDGKDLLAWVYVVKEPKCDHYPPHSDYVRVVQDGCRTFKMCEKRLLKAARLTSP